MSQSFKTNFTVGWSDLDPNGHMKNTAFLDQALDCRTMFFASYGLTWKDFEKFNMGPVFLKEELHYHKEMHLGQKGVNECRLLGMSPDGSHFKVENLICNEEGKLSAVVHSEVIWLNLKQRKITTPTKELHNILMQLPKATSFEELKNLSGKKNFFPSDPQTWRPEKSLGGLVLSAASKMKKVHEQRMAEQKLAHMKIQRMSILSFLSEQPKTQTDLCGLLNVSAPSMGQTLSKLEKEKLIQRKSDPNDGRRFFYSLTESGHADFKAAKQVTRDLGKGIDTYLRSKNTHEDEITRTKVIFDEMIHYLDTQINP